VGSEGRVIALEPNPENYATTRAHVSLNGLGERVELLQAAAGARDESVPFCLRGDVSHVAQPTDDVERMVRCVRLDTVLRDRPVGILKIDVEGYEFDVLTGARRCLAARPKIALEFHCFKFADPVEHVARVLDLLPRAGYEYQIAYEAGDELVDYTLDRDSASVIGSRYNPHLYALPRERYRKAST